MPNETKREPVTLKYPDGRIVTREHTNLTMQRYAAAVALASDCVGGKLPTTLLVKGEPYNLSEVLFDAAYILLEGATPNA